MLSLISRRSAVLTRSQNLLRLNFSQLRNPQLKKRFSTAPAVLSAAAGEGPTSKAVGHWLFGMAFLVASMVTIGGITRLTRSGLSMTDWKLQGNLPPTTEKQWLEEFDRYKMFPEWQQRQNMTLNEFKFIYFWEYGHRMMGRVLGVAFVVPGIYYASRGMIARSLYPRIGMLFGLGMSQGLIGWWMVKSGLEMDPEQRKEIRVSPYRLATHLSMAFTTYTLLLWTAMDILYDPTKMKNTLTKDCLKHAKSLRRHAAVNIALVATTVLSGAYVAGNDAGNAYNTFPKMGDDWIPPEVLDMTPLWKNFFENTALVQFDHRILALTSLSSIMAMYYRAIRTADGIHWQSFPRITRVLFHSAAGMSVAQVGLGISTLLLYVPIPLAAVHQIGSLVLMSFITALVHSMRFSKNTASSHTAKVLHTALPMTTKMCYGTIHRSIAGRYLGDKTKQSSEITRKALTRFVPIESK